MTRKITDLDKVKKMLKGGDKVAVQIAPAVRVAIGEEFGLDIGTNVVGKLVTALKKAGFSYVYDVCAGADYTIIEESKELATRFREKRDLPLFTSCCPVWVKFLEHSYPDKIKNLSTCKSPTEMLSRLIKHYDKDVKVVSVTPCVGKKIERIRHNVIDVCLTTKECAKLIKDAGIDLATQEESAFDEMFGVSSGAGTIFGVTGGVTEAILRTTTNLLNTHSSRVLEINAGDIKPLEPAKEIIRKNDGLREFSIMTEEGELKVGIVNGIASARKLLSDIDAGKEFHFVEFQNCKGGCVMGPGQPAYDKNLYYLDTIVSLRGRGLYDNDANNVVKSSHTNDNVLKVYKNVGEDKIEKMLHIHN